MSTTTNLTTLKINYLTQEQYDALVEGGTVNEDEIYLTPTTSSGGGGSSELPDSGVTAGTYGGYDSSTPYYYVPTVTVNSKGIVTSASQSYLGVANTKSTGLLSASDWDAFSHPLGYKSSSCYIGGGFNGTASFQLSNTEVLVVAEIPAVIGAYIRGKINSNTTRWIQAELMISDYNTSTSKFTVSAQLPEKYIQYNGDPEEEENVTSLQARLIYKKLGNNTAYSGSTM